MEQVVPKGKTEVKGKARHPGTFSRCIKALSPIPYLTRARDFYVRKITQCAGNSSYVGIAGAPGANMTLPKSFSTSSSYGRVDDDDYRELIRAASQRERPTPIKITKLMDHNPFPRSFSASTATDHHRRTHHQLDVGRIDEDSPCYFSGSFRKDVEEEVQFPRSRSYSTVQTSKPNERKNIAV